MRSNTGLPALVIVSFYATALLVSLVFLLGVVAVVAKSYEKYITELQKQGQKVKNAADCDLHRADDPIEDTHAKIDERYQDGFTVHYLHFYDNQDFTLCYVSHETSGYKVGGR